MTVPNPFPDIDDEVPDGDLSDGINLPAADNANIDEVDSEGTEGFYDDATITQEFPYVSGILQMPLASDTTDGTAKCELVQVCDPYGSRIILVTAKKWGEWPKLPDPSALGGRDVLIHSNTRVLAPPYDPKGAIQLCVVVARFVFAATSPRTPGKDLLPGSKLPTSTEDASDNDFPAENWGDSTLSTSDNE